MIIDLLADIIVATARHFVCITFHFYDWRRWKRMLSPPSSFLLPSFLKYIYINNIHFLHPGEASFSLSLLLAHFAATAGSHA